MTNSTQPRRENRLLNNVFIIICKTFTCSLHLINTNNICVMQCNTDIGRPRQNCNIINVISLRFDICLTGDFKMGSSTRGYNSHTSPLILTNIIYIYIPHISLLNTMINIISFNSIFIIHIIIILISIIIGRYCFIIISILTCIISSSSNIKIITSFNNLFSYNSTRSVFIILLIKYNFNIKCSLLFIIIYNIILYYIK